jgi:hypothetical protein
MFDKEAEAGIRPIAEVTVDRTYLWKALTFKMVRRLSKGDVVLVTGQTPASNRISAVYKRSFGMININTISEKRWPDLIVLEDSTKLYNEILYQQKQESFKSIKLLNKGDILRITGEGEKGVFDGFWFPVEHEGDKGWISEDVVKPKIR